MIQAQKKRNMQAILLMAICLIAAISAVFAADPEGAAVSYVSNSTKNATQAEYRNDSKGTITTLTITAIQQNSKWKAYVGNVTGTLVLRDSSDYSIYEWTALDNPTGRVYITRNDTISWSDIVCANETIILAEQEALNHTLTAGDNINHTFSSVSHESFYVGTIPITASSCQSTATWVNDTAQTVNEDALFQEVLLQDNNNLLYATIIEQNAFGYRNDSVTYDFQALVADSALPGVTGQSTYYFYIEISS